MAALVFLYLHALSIHVDDCKNRKLTTFHVVAKRVAVARRMLARTLPLRLISFPDTSDEN
jgi:hypothetical protein